MPDASELGPVERIGFLLVPDFSMLAFASALEPLRLANRHAGRTLYEWRLYSQDGAPATASNGTRIDVDGGLEALSERSSGLTTLFVCAGIDGERYENRQVIATLRQVARHGLPLGGLCTGAYLLARSGLLDGYRCTIHWENRPGFVEDFPDIEMVPHIFEVDRDRMTCAGGTAAIDMVLYMITAAHGEELATLVSAQCMQDRIRPADNDPRLPARVRMGGHHPKLVDSIEIMEQHLEDPIGADDLAHLAGLSRRQLERLFRKYIGRTPTQYYLGLRLERARYLLFQTDLSVLDVALACGFVSGSHFSKCYRQIYGRTPQAERRVRAA